MAELVTLINPTESSDSHFHLTTAEQATLARSKAAKKRKRKGHKMAKKKKSEHKPAARGAMVPTNKTRPLFPVVGGAVAVYVADALAKNPTVQKQVGDKLPMVIAVLGLLVMRMKGQGYKYIGAAVIGAAVAAIVRKMEADKAAKAGTAPTTGIALFQGLGSTHRGRRLSRSTASAWLGQQSQRKPFLGLLESGPVNAASSYRDGLGALQAGTIPGGEFGVLESGPVDAASSYRDGLGGDYYDDMDPAMAEGYDY